MMKNDENINDVVRFISQTVEEDGKIPHLTIKSIEEDIPVLGKDWFDLPMTQIARTHFQITLPLCETGHFEAKCYFLNHEENDPQWPEGKNTVIFVFAETFGGTTGFSILDVRILLREQFRQERSYK